MRPVAIIILGFSMLIAISLVSTNYITKASDVFQVELMATDELIHAEQWEEALLRIEEMQIKWSEYHDWWAIFLNHSVLTKIEISLNKLQQFTLAKDEALSLAEIQTLLVYLKDVYESELLKIHNIF